MDVKIYTKTGDKGTTSLFDGTRVFKDDIQVETYGTLDELNSIVGMLRTFNMFPLAARTLEFIQHKLYNITSYLASITRESLVGSCRVDEKDITALEKAIDQFTAMAGQITNFILPGGSPEAALCHVARTICRRAERRMVSLQKQIDYDPLALKYTNRLSDLFFAMARACNAHSGREDVFWNNDFQFTLEP